MDNKDPQECPRHPGTRYVRKRPLCAPLQGVLSERSLEGCGCWRCCRGIAQAKEHGEGQDDSQ